jgi:hypothetical protein
MELLYNLLALSILIAAYAGWLFYVEVLTPRKEFKNWQNDKRKFKGSHKQ